MKKKRQNLILGIILVIIAIISFLNLSGFINNSFLGVIIILGSLFFIKEIYSKESGIIRNIGLLIGILVLLLGLMPLLVEYRALSFFSFMPVLTIKKIFLELVLLIFGGYLIFDSSI